MAIMGMVRHQPSNAASQRLGPSATATAAAERRTAVVNSVTNGHATLLQTTLALTKMRADYDDNLLARVASLSGQAPILTFLLKSIRAPKGPCSRTQTQRLAKECLHMVLTVEQQHDADSDKLSIVWNHKAVTRRVRAQLLREDPDLKGACVERYLDVVAILVAEAGRFWHEGKPSWVVIDRAMRIIRDKTPHNADLTLLLQGVAKLRDVSTESNVTVALLTQVVCEAAGDRVDIVNALLAVPGLNPGLCENFAVRYADRYARTVLATLLDDGRVDPTARSSESLRACVAKEKFEHVELLMKSNPHVNPIAASLQGRLSRSDAMIHASAFSIALTTGNRKCISRLVEDNRVLENEDAVVQLMFWSSQQRSTGCGDMPFIRGLIRSQKIDPSMGRNALLIEACKMGDLALIDFLMDFTDPGGFEQRVICECNLYSEAVMRHLLREPRIDPSCYGQLPLFNACSKAKYEVIKVLLEDPRVDPSHNDYAIIPLTASAGSSRLLSYLVESLLGLRFGNHASPSQGQAGLISNFVEDTPISVHRSRNPNRRCRRRSHRDKRRDKNPFSETACGISQDEEQRQRVLRTALVESFQKQYNLCVDFLLRETDVDAGPVADQILSICMGSRRQAFPYELVERKLIDPSSADDFLLRHFLQHSMEYRLPELLRDQRVSPLRAPPGSPCALEIGAAGGRFGSKSVDLELLLQHPNAKGYADVIHDEKLIREIKRVTDRMIKYAVEDAAVALGIVAGMEKKKKLPPAWGMYICSMAFGDTLCRRETAPDKIMLQAARMLNDLHESARLTSSSAETTSRADDGVQLFSCSR
ncbi:Hypothetical Protein FCC1311_072732 [Hondaea fermentalgiana]|uniref:Uncharacterized protein n=1 Tax=Hondaea fermentalgiana TaxID=2315210 RepID=A0A2R5GJJ1_9STRA|nr:Hypothetical Protein FCC1311_072732 [Hondaea fermentalgiana]|eukprot:GBG31052.1 Hypothetical Protein FCC1311_072732 [Hondaea fermentalgiana]